MRTKRSFLNYVTGLGIVFGTVAVSVLTKRWLVAWLGVEILGAYQTGFELMALLGLMELGLTGAVTAMFARAVNQGDEEDVRAVFGVAVRAYYVLVVLSILAGAVMIGFVPRLVGDLDPAHYNDMRVGLAIALATTILPVIPVRGILDATQRGYLVNSSLIVQNVLLVGLLLVMAWFTRGTSWGITGQFTAYFLSMVVGGVMMILAVRRHHPGLLRGVFGGGGSRRHATTWRELFQLNLSTMVLKFTGQLSTGIDTLIVTWVVGIGFVVPFRYTQQLGLLVQQQLQSVGGATWASLSELYFKNEHDLFRARLIELSKLITIMGVAALVPILYFNAQFIAIWIPPERTGSDVYAGFAVTAFGTISALTIALLTLWGSVFQGTHQLHRLVPALLTSTVVNVALSVYAASRLGVVGPLLGTVIANLAVTFWWEVVLLRRHYGVSPALLLRGIGRPLLLGVPYAAGVGAIASRFQASGFVSLGLVMGLCGLAYLGATWLFLLNREEKTVWLGRFEGITEAIGRRFRKPRAPIDETSRVP